MEEKHILILVIVIAILGLAALFFIPVSSFKSVTVKEINALPLESKIELKGSISSIYKTNKVLTFNITDQTGEIKIVLFNPKNVNLLENSKIKVSGIVKTYKNNVEIHANSIKIQ